MKRIARLSVVHPLLVIGAWLLTLGGVMTASVTAGDVYSSNFSLPGTDAQAATDLLAERFPELGNASVDRIVWKVEDGNWDDPAVRTAIQGAAQTIMGVDSVLMVVLPFDGLAPDQVSSLGTIAYGTIHYSVESFAVPTSDIEAIVEAVNSIDVPGLTVAVGGLGIGQLNRPAVGLSDGLGVVVAALILFLAFRSIVGMFLPILSALTSVGLGLGTMSLLAHGMDINLYAPVIGAILGLGVGIDYGLLILNRHRTGLMKGRDVGDSIVGAVTTAGRAVFFAGTAVVVGLVGMLVPGLSFLTGLAIGAGITIAFTVLAAVSFLPAMMRLAGTRILRRKVRRALAQGTKPTEHPAGWLGLWAVFVSRHPVWVATAAVALLTALAWPIAGLRLGSSDQGNDPEGSTTRTAYDMLAEGFGPGFNGPLVVALDLAENPIDVAALQAAAASAPDGGSETTDPTAALAAFPQLTSFLGALYTDPGVATMVGPYPNSTGDAAIIQVIPTTAPQDAATAELLHRIRHDYAPLAAAQSVGVHVGGVVAIFDDFADTIQDALPGFFVIVILLGALLTIVAFRSLLIPAVGAVMNIISITVSFGVIVAIFQWGWGADILGTGEGGPIESFFPLVVFALIFGLSMDYQVFLVTRISEEWHLRRDNTKAVRAGHAEVSRVIISAAAIMIVVFAGFGLADSRVIKLFALGLSGAVLVDAFIIRMALVPALMRLIGRANWYLPKWLDRTLPHIAIDEASNSGTPSR